jgi:hypothetical protein
MPSQDRDEMMMAPIEAINLSELSAIRFSTSFDPATQRIVLHDLTPSTGGQAPRGGRRSIVVD